MATDTSSDPRRDKDTKVLNRSGLNPRRACIKRALTSSACVCANQRLPNSRITMSAHKRGLRLRTGCGRRPRPRLLRPRIQRGLCLWRTRACALHEHERLHREAHGMRCGVAASVVAAASSTRHQLHAACVPAPSPAYERMEISTSALSGHGTVVLRYPDSGVSWRKCSLGILSTPHHTPVSDSRAP